jgi:hypothetical protein
MFNSLNGSPFLSLKQYSVKAPSAHQLSSTNTIPKFGNSRDYYENLDPRLTENKLNQYLSAERRWRDIIRDIETQQGQNIFGIIRSKTPAELQALINKLRTVPNLVLHINLPQDRASANIGPEIAAYTTRRNDGKAVIHTYSDLNNHAEANNNFLTLAHEAMHAMHVLRGTSISPMQYDAGVPDIERLEGCLNRLVNINNIPPTLNGWKQHFNQIDGLYSDFKDSYTIPQLNKVKTDLISEAAAYRMSAYIGHTNQAVQFERNRAEGYRAAVSWINDIINAKTIGH